MVKHTLLVLLTIIGLNTFAQESNNEFAEYCNIHGWFIAELPKEKLVDQKEALKKIEIADKEHVDLNALGIEFSESDYQYFIVINSDKLLSVKPLNLLLMEWKRVKSNHE